MKSKLFPSLILLCSAYIGMVSDASACSFGVMQYFINFAPQQSKLDPEEERKFKDWFIKWRDGDGIAEVAVIAKTVKGDETIRTLSVDRVNTVKAIMKVTSTDGIKANFGYDLVDNLPKEALNSALNKIEVYIQPACTKTNSCCPEPIAK